MSNPSSQTIFEKLGGAPAVEACTEIFYKKVLTDPMLMPFFEGVSMQRQKAKQVAFLTYVFGGPSVYAKKGGMEKMAKIHVPMIRDKGLGLKHFDQVASHLVKSMQELSVPQELIDAAFAVVMSTRPLFDPELVLKQHPAPTATTTVYKTGRFWSQWPAVVAVAVVVAGCAVVLRKVA